MENKYKIIVSNENIYKEFELPCDKNEAKLGTEVGCEFRLYKDLFFGPIELTFINNNGNWSIFGSEHLYLNSGDSRKLLTVNLKHGDIYFVKYNQSNNDVFSIEFLINFDDTKRNYEKAIDVSRVSHFSIGAEKSNQIILKSPYIKKDYISFVKDSDNELNLSISETTYGFYHNGIKVSSKCKIKNGDFFSLSDYIFYYKDGLIWTEIRTDISINGLSYYDYPNQNNYPKFIRNARIKNVLNKDKIEILDPPPRPQKQKNNLLMTLLPTFIMLLTSIAMGAIMGGTMIIFSVISGISGIVTAVMTIIQAKKDYEKELQDRKEKYTAYIENKKKEITEFRDEERASLEKIYSNTDKEMFLLSTFSSSLFDRRPSDDDFLNVRLGIGTIKSERQVEYKKQERLEVEDEFQLYPEQISNEFSFLDNAPVICDFKKNSVVGIIGQEQYRFSIMKNIIIDICARQYHSDIRLFFIAEEKNKDKIENLRFLPHVTNEFTNSRNIACDFESKNRIFDYLYKEFTFRSQNKDSEKKELDHIIVFFYDEFGFKSHPVSKFVDYLNNCSATFVFMADEKDLIPQGCSSLIKLSSDTSGSVINAADESEKTDFTFKKIHNEDFYKTIELLSPIYTEEISLEGTLTKNISLFEMLHIFSSEDLNLDARWNSSKVYQSMSAPIGVTKNGIVCLDLHDKAHGPHGLVAGTTGSGKSEILQTYILSVATLFHPYEIAFVIIDFKGGGMVNQFKNLPHLIGAITNIDGKEIDRSLKSIKAELQKRQRLFAEADVNHIDKYIQKFKSGAVKIPVPHLVLIVDEFAELKAEQPDFMKELISAARIGRSLGVHLILATQKPSGQVDDQIWSNSKFKLCLKVQTQEDSNEVLKSPLAAEIKEPGRAYLQVGNNEIFELFQSAYSGAPEKMDDMNVKEYTIYSVSTSGKRTPVFSQKKKKSSNSINTQLESIVNYVHGFCAQKRIEKLPNICLPPLSKSLSYPTASAFMNGMIDIGIYDDPDNQVQKQTYIDFLNKNTIILGSSQYGKTNLLQSIIRTITSNTTPRQSSIYILDFGSMFLKNFEKLNHVGGVVTSSEDEKLKNLFKILFEEVSKRKERLVSVGVSSFSSYLDAGYTDLSHIYLIIDNLTALIELYLEDDDSLLTLLREGLSVGISVIIANSQTSGISFKYLSNFANKIALYCNDGAEYTTLFDSSTIHPDEVPGRCIVEIEKRILECQTYLAFNGKKEIDRVEELKKFIEQANRNSNGFKARAIPFIPNVLTVEAIQHNHNALPKGFKIPIGLTYNGVEPFYLDLSQLGIIGLCGKENTGHKNFISYVMSTLESSNARVAIFDDVTRKFEHLKDNPLVDIYTLNVEQIKDVISEWYEVLSRRYDNLLEMGDMCEDNELLLLIIQNNDVARIINDDFSSVDQFSEMVSKFKGTNIAIIFSNYQNSSLPYDAPEPLMMVKKEQHVLFFEDLDTFKPFDIPYEEVRSNRKRLETGDAYYIQENSVVKLKMIKADDR